MTTNKQAEIVTAAIGCFQQKGYHATSMQDIADAVGLQKGSLYHYIAGKEDLLVVIIQETMAQYNARLAEIRGMEVPVRQKLEMAVHQHLKGIADNLGMLTIFLRESYALNSEQQQVLSEESDRYNQMFEELFAEGIRVGAVRNLDPKLATRTMLGACNWFYRWYRPEGSMGITEISQFVIDLLFNGVAAGTSALPSHLASAERSEPE